MAHRLTRRQFLKTLGLTGSALWLDSCTPATPPPTPSPLPTRPLSTASPTPGVTPTAQPTITPTPDERTRVVLARAATYDQADLRSTLENMVGQLGGLTDTVKPGMRVGIKLNLTGGTWWDTPDKPPATEYFVSHPAMAGALAEILFDLGASQVTLMDGLGDPTSFEKWGYQDLVQKLGVGLLDLCQAAPYAGFDVFPVGDPSLVYPSFALHPALHELDVLISMAKMKCHTTTGVTLSLKNLIGLAPTSLYRRHENDNNRSDFHGDVLFDTRLPRVVIDLNRAQPIHLALVDGIRTAEAGAGPWDKNMTPVRPGLLALGKNPVAVDAVCSAVMGFDPEAPGGTSPFIGGENHLVLAQQAGLGPNRLADIRVEGLSLEEARFPFKPAI